MIKKGRPGSGRLKGEGKFEDMESIGGPNPVAAELVIQIEVVSIYGAPKRVFDQRAASFDG
jgi:hypothetical protein